MSKNEVLAKIDKMKAEMGSRELKGLATVYKYLSLLEA